MTNKSDKNKSRVGKDVEGLSDGVAALGSDLAVPEKQEKVAICVARFSPWQMRNYVHKKLGYQCP